MIEPITIEPEALYDDGALCQALGLTPTTLAAARRSGVLQFVRLGKRTFYKGSWLMDWIEASATQPQGFNIPSPPR